MTGNLLQERINELDSAIFNIVEDKVHLTGFFNEKRLMTRMENKMDNWRSKGLYDYDEKVSFRNIKNNALFLIMKDGEVTKKHKYTVYKREEVERKSKSGPLILTIRQHKFTEDWQVLVLKQIHDFPSKQEMEVFLNENYRFDFEL